MPLMLPPVPTRHKNVDLTFHLLPKLWTGGVDVGLWVCWIFKLPSNNGARDLLSKRVGFGDGAAHALRARRQHQLSPVNLHELAAFNGHRIRHHDDDAIAKIRANRRKDQCRCCRWLVR